MAKRLKKFLVLLLVLPQIASTCQGTETGNPQFNPGEETGCTAFKVAKAAAGSDETLDDLILAICRRLIACGTQATVDACVNALNGEDGDLMTDEFGLGPETAITTIDGLRAALLSGSVVASEAAAGDCEADIGAIACADAAAGVPSSDFSNTENLIPDSCAAVFTASPDAGETPSSDCP